MQGPRRGYFAPKENTKQNDEENILGMRIAIISCPVEVTAFKARIGEQESLKRCFRCFNFGYFASNSQ